MTTESIIFPGLNIVLESVGDGVSVFGFRIAYYGLVIGLGMLIAAIYIYYNAKRYGENPDDFSDIFIIGIISGVIGARLYYVIFSWDLYKDNLLSIFNLRAGGLAIFGGIIAGAISVICTSRIKKIPFLKVGDIVIPGVLIGQVLGRFGNFFNREAFGEYSSGIFRMGIPVERIRNAADITDAMRAHSQYIDGIEFVFVHPTFLYEATINLITLVVLIIIGSKRHKNGLAAGIYFISYGVGRFFIESLRTDQLKIPGTGIPVSMVVALISIIFGIIIISKKSVDNTISNIYTK